MANAKSQLTLGVTEAAQSKRHYPARDEDHTDALFETLNDVADFPTLHEVVANWLTIPSSLAGIWRIGDILPSILALAGKLDDAISYQISMVERWVSSILAIPIDTPIRRIAVLSKVNCGHDKNRRPYISPPLEGTYLSHPVWAAFWFVSGTNTPETLVISRTEAFRTLQALFLCACIRFASGIAVLTVPRRIVEACFLLRSIHQPQYGAYLDRLCKLDDIDIDGAYALLDECHSDVGGEFRQGFGALADMLNEAYDLGNESVFSARLPQPFVPRLTIRQPGYSRPTLIYSDHSLYWLMSDKVGDSFGDELRSSISQFEGPGQRALDEIYTGGAHPDEFSIQIEQAYDCEDFHDLDADGDVAVKLPPLSSVYASARGRTRAMDMWAQAHTIRRNRPQMPLLVRVVSTLETILVNPTAFTKSVSKIDLLQETVKLAAVCLFTGELPSEVVKLHAFDSSNALPQGWRIAFSLTYQVWLRPYQPPERSPLAEELARNQIAITPRIALSDALGIGSALGMPSGGRWFLHSAASYQRMYKAVIEPELVKAGVPPRRARFDGLAELMPNWVHGLEEGEMLRNAAIYGRAVPETNSLAHYAALERQQLDSYFRNVMATFWDELAECGFEPSGCLFALSPPSWIPDSMTGSDWCPSPDRIRELQSCLRQRITECPEDAHYRRHNLIVAYLGIGLACALGFRDIRTPILDLELIHPGTGFIYMQEKDRPDGRHVRLVWVPPRLLEQIQRYLTYQRGLWVRLPAKLRTHLMVKATKARDRRFFGSEIFELDLRKTLFFFERVGNEWKPREYTGEHLQAVLAEEAPGYWSVANFGRHLLATRLINAEGSFAVNCRTVMGHWLAGELSWSPDSGISPVRYRQQIAPVVESVLDDIGFEVIRFS